MKKAVMKTLLILVTVLFANLVFIGSSAIAAEESTSRNVNVNPGVDPNLATKLSGSNVEANISHCQAGHNYCEGCCQHEIQVAREKATAATSAATAKKDLTRTQDGSQ